MRKIHIVNYVTVANVNFIRINTKIVYTNAA